MTTKMNIMIVDDEMIVRKSLFHWFERSGHRVDTAPSGFEALEKLETTPFDLLFVDIKMPGMDGIELLEKVKSEYPETVVVIIAVFAFSKLQGQMDLSIPREGGKIVLMAARQLVPWPVGVLLLGAACAVVISTGMNYLLSPSTNIMRDVYQRFLNKEAKQSTMVALQKVFVVILGVVAFFLAIKMQSVLDNAIFAYTIYGVAITPALIAALAWKRVTKVGGLASIISGTVVCLVLRLLVEILPERLAPEGDPFGIPLIYPSLFVSIAALIIGSLLTKKQDPEMIKKFFPGK